MQNTPENLSWAVGKLEELQVLPSFPRSEPSLQAVARHFLRMVHNVTVKHASLGPVNDADWLIDQILSKCERFPIPLEMREIYSNSFLPADEGELPSCFRVDP